MKWMTKNRMVCSIIGGAIAVTLLSTSVVTLADHIHKESTQTIGDTIEVTNMLNQTVPEKVLTEGNITVDMIDQQLENTSVVELESKEEVAQYLEIDEDNVITGEANVVKEVDNSASKYFPPIGDQGALSTCTAWATVYYQMSYALNKQLDREGNVPENIMSPYWVYSMINNGQDTGTYYSDALKILTEVGAVSIKTVPIDAKNEDILYNIKAKKENWLEARKNRVEEYYTLNIGDSNAVTPVMSPTDPSLDSIKNALAAGEIFTATTYASCWKTEQIKEHSEVPTNGNYINQQIITRTDDNSELAHRVTIVGYNDDIWVDINHDGQVQEGEKGAFKIANSYGDQKDNEGFIWMSYDAVNAVSSVDSNPSFPLKSDFRKVGLFAVIGFTVDTNIEDNNTLLQIEFTSDDAKSIQLNIKAQSRDTDTIYEYAPVPFSNSNLMQNVGNSNLNGVEADGNKGTFCIDLSNVVTGITPDKLDDYNWEISVMDATEDESGIKVTEAKFYNALDDVYIESSLKQQIELESTNILITRGRDISSDGALEVNSAVYSFEVTDREKYTFSTPKIYADKRYYDIYILDEEYKGNVNEISKKYSVSKTTRDGSIAIKLKKGKYVYCVAKNKSAWSGFVYRNKAKLNITIE